MAITADARARAVLSALVSDPELEEIERLPLLSWAHIGLTAGVWGTLLLSSTGYLAGWLPLPVAIALNAVAVYAAFTTVHDATHRAVSSNPWLNDLLGTISATALFPGVTTAVYRVLHLEHHRWVGDPERDPDTPVVDAKGLWVPFVLAFPELVWAHWWVTRLWHRRLPRERLGYFISLSVYALVHAAFLLSPYAWEFVLLWLIPQKLGVMFTVYSFARIQHPEGVDWKSAPLQATAVIDTEPRWLVYAILLGQSDHHIHHLLPHIPYHRYHRVWGLADGALHRETLAKRGWLRGFDEDAIASVRTTHPVRVESVRPVADGVLALRFEPLAGRFPPFEPGAHIDVHLPSGTIRQYSLCGPQDSPLYEIAVKLDPQGRGGSKELHAIARPGLRLTLGAPRNLFRLHPETRQATLIAGGIGITPLLAMARHLHAQGIDFQLHLCARRPADIPFDQELRSAPFADQVQRHVDQDGHPSFDPAVALGPHQPGRHAYLCGPAGFMDFVRREALSLGWPADAVHSESFGAAPLAAGQNRPFTVEARASGKTVQVPADATIVDALRGAGIELPTACLQGVCGRCKTRVVAGEVEHRDAVLQPQERTEFACPCVSRAAGERLVLDC